MLHEDIAGLVLAGGKSRRFGSKAKAFQILAGEPLIAHALRPLRHLRHIAINANEDEQALAAFAPVIVSDLVQGAGPLGGIHAGLAWAGSLVPEARWLATVAIDTPFLPDDLIETLAAARDNAVAIVAATNADFSPVCALWRTDQLPQLTTALERGVRKMTDYLDLVRSRTANISGPMDPLFNINTSDDLDEAERLVRAHSSMHS